jgi:hypothetical protein
MMRMAVEVQWFATLVKRTRSRQATTEVPWSPGLTPLRILLDEGLSETDAEAVLPVIHGEQVELTHPLIDGIRLEFIVSISGGAALTPPRQS